MLNNIWVFQKSHFLVKNTFYTTNVAIFGFITTLLTSINLLAVNILEKYFVEYLIKNVYNKLNTSTGIYVTLILQISAVTFM